MDEGVLTGKISKSLELWTIISSYDISLVLLLLGLLLHFAGGYYNQSLKWFGIRVSKENWSILFFLIRDFSLFASFGIGLLLVNTDMFADVKLPMPFFPLGLVLLGIALIYKLKGTSDDNTKYSKRFDLFLILAAIVQYFGFVFVMEAAPAEWVEAGVAGSFWLMLRDMRSNLNPALSMWTFYLSFPALMVILGIILKQGLGKKFDYPNEPRKKQN